MKRTTWQQAERQKTRSAGGRYAKLKPCDLCRKSAGADYHTDDRCHTRADAFGFYLCVRCSLRLGKLSDVAFHELADATLAARRTPR